MVTLRSVSLDHNAELVSVTVTVTSVLLLDVFECSLIILFVRYIVMSLFMCGIESAAVFID